MTAIQRNLLGVITAALVVAGAVGWFTQDDRAGPGILLRAGVVLGAVWLAAPGFHRLPRRVSIGLAFALGITALRPRLVLGALVVGAIIAVLWKRPAE